MSVRGTQGLQRVYRCTRSVVKPEVLANWLGLITNEGRALSVPFRSPTIGISPTEERHRFLALQPMVIAILAPRRASGHGQQVRAVYLRCHGRLTHIVFGASVLELEMRLAASKDTSEGDHAGTLNVRCLRDTTNGCRPCRKASRPCGGRRRSLALAAERPPRLLPSHEA